jgi:hypothetical protein
MLWLAHVRAMHGPPPQTLKVPPPPHTWLPVQVPQSIIPPQPSPVFPQL